MNQIPRAPLILGLAGLIPFLWGAASAHVPALGGLSFLIFGPNQIGGQMVLHYGIIILAFMAGVLWGFATRATRQAGLFYTLSVLPAIWVFLAMTGPLTWRFLALGLGYLGLLALDRAFVRAGLAPPWWMRLRLMLTAVVLTAIAIAAIA